VRVYSFHVKNKNSAVSFKLLYVRHTRHARLATNGTISATEEEGETVEEEAAAVGGAEEVA
jgi:hypothetical protein